MDGFNFYSLLIDVNQVGQINRHQGRLKQLFFIQEREDFGAIKVIFSN